MIHKLPFGTIRLISSTQVITSLYSVVKELIENALDAQCDSIDVRLEGNGLTKIELQDNGTGIALVDVENICQRHFTSKIKDDDDLLNLSTYGFRGEALFSLCSVADVSIITKTKDDTICKQYNFDHSGNLLNSVPTHHNIGTVVIIKNLFKDLPVRKQIFSNARKMKEQIHKIEDLLIAYGLIHHELRVILKNEKNVIFRKNRTASHKYAISSLFGTSVLDNLQEVGFSEDEIEVAGFLPKLKCEVDAISRATSDRIFIFVNERPVLIKEITSILKQYFKEHCCPSGSKKYPYAILFIKTSASDVDVNLEPNKTTVLLQNMDKLLHHLKDLLDEVYSNKENVIYEENREESTKDTCDISEKSIDSVHAITPELSGNKTGNSVTSIDTFFLPTTNSPDRQNMHIPETVSSSVANAPSVYGINHDKKIPSNNKRTPGDVNKIVFSSSCDASGCGMCGTVAKPDECVITKTIRSDSSVLHEKAFAVQVNEIGGVKNNDSSKQMCSNSSDEEELIPERNPVNGNTSDLNLFDNFDEEFVFNPCTPKQTNDEQDIFPQENNDQSCHFDNLERREYCNIQNKDKEVDLLKEKHDKSHNDEEITLDQRAWSRGNQQVNAVTLLQPTSYQPTLLVEQAKRKLDLAKTPAKKLKISTELNANQLITTHAKPKRRSDVPCMDVQFSFGEFRSRFVPTKQTVNRSQDNLTVVGRIPKSSLWVLKLRGSYHVVDKARLSERLLFDKLIKKHKFKTTKLDKAIKLTNILSMENLMLLDSLETDTPLDTLGRFISDLSIVDNGFVIKKEQDVLCNQTHFICTHMNDAITEYNINDLMEILDLMHSKSNIIRSKKAVVWCQTEATRLATSSAELCSLEEMEETIMQLNIDRINEFTLSFLASESKAPKLLVRLLVRILNSSA